MHCTPGSTDRFWLYTPEAMIEVLHLAHVRTPPEVDHKYSNFAYELLGVVVERVAGRPYTEQVRDGILGPLGMQDTTWTPDPGSASGSRRRRLRRATP